MKYSNNTLPFLLAALSSIRTIDSFAPLIGNSKPIASLSSNIPKVSSSSALRVSVGLGPDAEEAKVEAETTDNVVVEVEPDHELFRDSRLSDFDKECDSWYESLLKGTSDASFLGKVSEEAERRIRTLHKLERNVSFIYSGVITLYPIFVSSVSLWSDHHKHHIVLL
jgi:hypothetical protein